MAYIPNAQNFMQPTGDKPVASAAPEFRALKTFVASAVNSQTAVQAQLSALQAAIGAGDNSVALAANLGASNGSSLVGWLQTGTGAVARFVYTKLQESVSVFDYIPVNLHAAIVAGTSIVNVQPYIQVALTANPGRNILFPSGTYMVARGSAVYSKTAIIGESGAKIKALVSSWAGTTGVTGTAPFFYNVNNGTTVLTDQDISVCNIEFDYDTVTVVGGGCHAIRMRAVLRPRVMNCIFNKGENGVAFLACKDSMIDESEAYDVSNCFFDHWDGAISGVVRNCTGRNTPGVNMAQGIQFTGTGSLYEDRNSALFLAEGNKLFGVRNTISGSASAIIFNGNDAGSTVVRCKSIGNYVEDSDIGWCAQGASGQHQSSCDTFRNVDKLPIFFTADASGSPSNCEIVDPVLIDCNHVVTNIAMIVIQGTKNRIKGVRVVNTIAASYQQIVWLPVEATACYVEIEKADTGTVGRVVLESNTSLVLDKDDDGASLKDIPTIASAVTISPVNGTIAVSGTAAIATITPFAGALKGGLLYIIPTGVFTTTTAGNIARAVTAVVDKLLILQYSQSTGKWYPSY